MIQAWEENESDLLPTTNDTQRKRSQTVLQITVPVLTSTEQAILVPWDSIYKGRPVKALIWTSTLKKKFSLVQSKQHIHFLSITKLKDQQ